MDDKLIEAIHANRLVAAERVAHLSKRSRWERVGPWLLIDTGEASFANANSATPLEAYGDVTLSEARSPGSEGETREHPHPSPFHQRGRGDQIAEGIEMAVAWFGERGASFHFVVRRGVDALLEAELERRGYIRTPSELTMTRAAPVVPRYDGPLAIREVRDDVTLERYGGVGWPGESRRIGVAIARTASTLGFTLLVGEIDGQPVASATTVVTGGLAGIYNVVVEPAFRRRGFGTAMTWAAIEAGLAHGATTVWLGASDMARPMYLKMGFAPHFEYAHLGESNRQPATSNKA